MRKYNHGFDPWKEDFLQRQDMFWDKEQKRLVPRSQGTRLLPSSPLFNKTKQHSCLDKLLGPWEGAKKALHFGTNILDKEIVTSERLTVEDTQELINSLIAVHAIDNSTYSTTERQKKESTTTDSVIDASTKTEKPKVITLDKDKRYGFEVKDNLLIKVDETCWDKMVCWIGLTEKEISGLGCVRQEKGGIFRIYDVFLFEQENTSNFTDIDDLAVQKLMIELDELDSKDNGTRFQDMRFWWHSHASYDVNWSTQDDHNIQEKLFGSDPSNKPVCPWWLSIVLNKKGKVNTRLDIAEPWLTMDKVAYSVKHRISSDIKTFCKAEYDKKVKESTPIVTEDKYKHNNYGHNGYGSSYSHNSHKNTTNQNKTTPTTPAKENIDKDKTSMIPHPVQRNTLEAMTVPQAYKLWEKEIIDGMAWIYSLILDYNADEIKTPALAWRPRRLKNITKTKNYNSFTKKTVETDTGYIWTFSGDVKQGDYLLTIWPYGNSLHLSKITDIVEPDINKPTSFTFKNVTNDRFANLVLKTTPNWDYHDNYESLVSIVFRTKKTLPFSLLGDIFLDEIATKSSKEETKEDNWSEEDNWKDETGTKEETTLTEGKVEKTKTEEEEEEDLYDYMIAYAMECHRSELVRRIQGWVENLERDVMLDLIEILSQEMDTVTAAIGAVNIASQLEDEELIALVMELCKMDLFAAFFEVFLITASPSYCPSCYEPLFKAPPQCPACKTHISWN